MTLYTINEDGTYDVNNHTMHTWEELAAYLLGYGDAVSAILNHQQAEKPTPMPSPSQTPP